MSQLFIYFAPDACVDDWLTWCYVTRKLLRLTLSSLPFALKQQVKYL